MDSLKSISIHLMLLFIFVSYCENVYFLIISIHLMLLFIVTTEQTTETKSVFQYISCYCLSQEPQISMSILRYFNTSHVTVYLRDSIINCLSWIFQYISCYCLSICNHNPIYIFYISIHLMLLFIGELSAEIAALNIFQYISCYCLSTTCRMPGGTTPSFQYISCYCLSGRRWDKHVDDCNFNTSHVTVYREKYPTAEQTLQFQYISCYCLSKVLHPNGLSLAVFQYISCYCLSLS